MTCLDKWSRVDVQRQLSQHNHSQEKFDSDGPTDGKKRTDW